MNFDKSKVYTALNADDIKVGSKGYFADNIAELQRCVFNDDKDSFFTIKEIIPKDENYRFLADNHSGDAVSWNLFYLVEEPKEKKFRPYKDTDEMVEDFKRRYNSYGGWSGKDNLMYNPLIWIRNDFGKRKLITSFDYDTVYIQKWILLSELFASCTYLDGSPCGIEE